MFQVKLEKRWSEQVGSLVLGRSNERKFWLNL